MAKKKCNHKSFWEIYKIINFNRTFCEEKGRKFTCAHCGEKCNLEWKGYTEVHRKSKKRFFTYFLWMLPAILLIFLAITQLVTYISAIIAITLFHFTAMYFIIKSDRLIIKCS